MDTPPRLLTLPDDARARLATLLPPLVRDLRSTSALGWEPTLVARSQAAVEELMELVSPLALPELQSAARELYAYLAGARLSRAPDENYAREFGERTERVATLLGEFLPHPDENARCIDVFSRDGHVPAALEHAFGLSGFRTRGFSTAEALTQATTQQPAVALLVEAPLVGRACEALDALARQVPASGSMAIVAFGGGKGGERLQALLAGAELYFERLDDPGLAPRLVEVIERPREDPYRVLVVDDDAGMRLYLKVVLEQAGMKVECVEADRVVEAIGRFEPDLLLVDLYMPGIDGMSLTMELRLQPELAMLPIVFLSGEQGDETRFQAIQLGGDDFLTKPVRPRILIAAVRSRIKRARSVRRQLPVAGPAAIQVRGGQLRRGDFLAQLGEAMRNPRGPWQVLMSVKLDQAKALDERLGLAGAFELEQRVAERMGSVLQPDDAFTLWLEYGFGILVDRAAADDVRALARRLCEVVAAEAFDVRGEKVPLTLSVGVALPPSGAGAGDPDRWFASAYAAQAIAHRLGGNRFDGVLSREHGDMPPERVLIVREWVKEATTGENIIVEFQPILPLRGDSDGLYALVAKLRDYRAPLAGVRREEYLQPAREAGAMALIDRVGLFHAFEAIEEQRERQRATRVLVPMDLASFDNAQMLWLVAELRRRKAHASGLVIEVDAGLLLERPDSVEMVQRLRGGGICISVSDPSGGMTRLERLQSVPADLLRLPFRAVAGVPPKAFAELLAPWRAAGRQLIVDHVEDMGAVSQLWSLGVAHVQGDALAAAGPRLDYDFLQPGV
jgi:CheY-like chemotaxis protein/EAL domain-containing protein (putative c-di-GMP-specific phosphodiesterase class I)/GGDEF domain-containing protein